MSFNKELETLFTDFTVDNVKIPVAYMYYRGNETTYITYTQTYKDHSFAAEDKIAGFIVLYDVDIFSKANYLDIVDAVVELLEDAGWTYMPSRDSEDMYEVDTGYFHKTICFAKEREVNNDD